MMNEKMMEQIRKTKQQIAQRKILQERIKQNNANRIVIVREDGKELIVVIGYWQLAE
jgi:hypothetical protein